MDYCRLELSADQDNYALQAVVTLARLEDWLGVEAGQELRLQCAGEDYVLVVESRSQARGFGERELSVTAASPAVRLGEPWATPLTNSWSNATARSIATELCALGGVPLDWRLTDWTLELFSVEGQTPLQALQTLVTEAGRLVSRPDGTLVAQYLHPVSPTRYGDVLPALQLSAYADITSLDSRTEYRPGYNAVDLVSSPEGASEGLSLQEWQGAACDETDGAGADRGLSAGQKLVAAVTWPYRTVSLSTSHGEAVLLPQGEEEFVCVEQVELVEGAGSLKYPAEQVLQTDYGPNRDLGAVTVEGRAVTTAEAGQSLLTVRYLGRVQLWLVEHAGEDRVQVVADGADGGGGSLLLTVQRGRGDCKAPDIIEDPLCRSLAILQERGRNYLDEEGFAKQRVEIGTPLRPLPLPGAVVEVQDLGQGETWRGKLLGWKATVENGDNPDSTVAWTVERSEVR